MLKVGCVFWIAAKQNKSGWQAGGALGNWTIPVSGAREKQLGLTPRGLGLNAGIQGMNGQLLLLGSVFESLRRLTC